MTDQPNQPPYPPPPSPDPPPSREPGSAVTASAAAVERYNRLQAITAALAPPLTASEIVAIIVEQATAALGAKAGLVALVTPDGKFLELVRTHGFSAGTMDAWHRFRLDAPLPLSDVVREATPLFLEDRADWHVRYPEFEHNVVQGYESGVAMPLLAGEKAFGGIWFTFPPGTRFSAEERSFLLTLARQCAQALERARLLDAEREARKEAEEAQRRVSFLASASAALSSSLDYATTLNTMANIVVPHLADWCAVQMPDEESGTLRHVAVAHVDPEKVRWAREIQQLYPSRLDEPGGAAEVLRSGQSLFLPDVPEEMLAAVAKNEEHLRLIREIGFRSAIAVPLKTRSRTLGVLLMVTTAESGRRLDEDDLAFAEELAIRAALAVDNARLYREAQEEIEQRRRTSDALEQREREFVALVEGSPDIISRFGPDLRCTYTSPAVEKAIGMPADFFIGKTHAEMGLPPEFCALADASLRRIFETGEKEAIEFAIPGPSGMRYYDAYGVPHFGPDGRVESVMTVSRDITERKRAEEERALHAREREEAAIQQRAFLRDVLASVTEGHLRLCDSADDLPSRLSPCGEPVELSRRTLKALRRRTEEAIESRGFARERWHDLETALGEASMNAVVHAGGGVAQVCADGPDGPIQVWIEDKGQGIDMHRLPQATLEPGFSSAGSLGHGFYLMLHTADRIWLLTGPGGTTVVLEQEKDPPHYPPWLHAYSGE